MTPTFLEGPAWEAAPLLLGWRLESHIDGQATTLTLTEVEAYDQADPASHSYHGPTPRTESMFGPPGHLYVYRSYGLHWCSNVTTGPPGRGAAVLLRAGVPTAGRAIMKQRRGRADHLTDGPGKLSQAMGISGLHDGLDLFAEGSIRLVPGEAPPLIRSTTRIGLARGQNTPWRFVTTPQ
jgi:DNA-3-methyladenine glycosylase